MPTRTPYPIDADWPTVSLSDVTTKIGSGATPRGGAELYLASRQNYAFVRSQNIHDRWFDVDALAFISDDQASGLRGVLLQPGDVLLNITGDGVTFGRAAMVDESALPACVNQHVSIIRADPAKVVPGYLLAYLTHPDVKPYLASFNSGGSRRAITKGHIESFQVPLPPIDVQQAIAATLGALDDKIESNRRSIGLLRKISRALYQDAKKSTRRASDVLTPVLGGTPKREVDSYWAGQIRWASAKDIAAAEGGFVINTLESITQAGVENSAAKVLPAGTVVMTARGTVGALARLSVPMAFNQSCYGLVSDEVQSSTLFLALEAAVQRIQDSGHGTVFNTVNMATFDQIELEIPADLDVIYRVEEISTLVLQRLHESNHLTKVRDALLPELLSGRIRVPVEAAA